ncbi:hypothetical protein BCEP4_600051 [Burkholderia cepacia]|nr:hypothetical protein BCEP4_600051 [Burkholderia cepacia]
MPGAFALRRGTIAYCKPSRACAPAMRAQGVPVYEHGVFFFRRGACLRAPRRACRTA